MQANERPLDGCRPGNKRFSTNAAKVLRRGNAYYHLESTCATSTRRWRCRNGRAIPVAESTIARFAAPTLKLVSRKAATWPWSGRSRRADADVVATNWAMGCLLGHRGNLSQVDGLSEGVGDTLPRLLADEPVPAASDGVTTGINGTATIVMASRVTNGNNQLPNKIGIEINERGSTGRRNLVAAGSARR